MRACLSKPAVRMVLAKIAEMRAEGLRLYQSLPHAEPFHVCGAKWRVAWGPNRSGKTVTTEVEAVRAWLGCDPYRKYRPTNGMSIVVALDADQLGMLWAKCSQPGAFKIIRDEQTHQYRAVRPDPNNPRRIDPYDLAYKEKWRDAPPLIPPRMIRNVSWYDRAQGIPRQAEFTTGWRSLWRPGGGPPPHGDHYDFALLDEHIGNPEFYYEIVRGLVDSGSEYRSLGVWSATPQKQNFLIWELCQQAEQGSPNVRTFFFPIEDNPYIDEGERQIFYDSLPEDQRRVRYEGIHAIAAWRMYPRFDPMGAHGCEPIPIPPDWTLYLALDPGMTVCATIMGAVDPQQRHLWIIDQILLQPGGAERWAMKLAEHPYAKRFHAWIIDQAAGRARGMAGYATTAAQYFTAAKARGIVPRVYGTMSGFHPGCMDPEARREALLGKLWIRDSGPLAGTTELQIFRGSCPDLVKQVQRAQFDQKNPQNRIRGDFDLLDALEYLVAFNPGYVPRLPEPESNPVYAAYLEARTWDRPSDAYATYPGLEISL